MTGTPELSLRTLNRTFLARQLLLRREERATADVLEHLVGMQAQEPFDPYVGLWSRIEAFDPNDLSRLLESRRAVRATLMRVTIHLVTARDYVAIRPVVNRMIEQAFRRTPFGRDVEGVDLDALIRRGVALLDERPRGRMDLGRALARHWADVDPGSLGAAVAYLVPLVQTPPRAVWGAKGRVALAPAASWLGSQIASDGPADDLVLRYLRAFGPASVADASNWSRLTKLREVFERHHAELRTFRSPDGRELFDLTDAPIADPDRPAPVRFLPVFDNVYLGHAVRTRITARQFPPPEAFGRGPVLVDGFIRAAWTIELKKDHASLVVQLLDQISPAERSEVTEEGMRFLTFMHPGATHDVRFPRAAT